MAALDELPASARDFIHGAKRQHPPVIWLAIWYTGISERELLERLRKADTL